MKALLPCYYIFLVWQVESMVLDPALYLSPSPPMVPTSDSVDPSDLWAQPAKWRIEREADDLSVIPIDTRSKSTTAKPMESMATAETFWPNLRTADYSTRSIHIPLAFSISGAYCRYGTGESTGVITSHYASVVNDENSNLFQNFGKPSYAGSSYGSYGASYPGTRIYGNGGVPGWSGWGNGKWGHYGKG